jgi:hypothetical protein
MIFRGRIAAGQKDIPLPSMRGRDADRVIATSVNWKFFKPRF